MGDHEAPMSLHWHDYDGRGYSWPSIGAWAAEWWAAQREATVAFRALEAGSTGVRWPDSPARDALEGLVSTGDERCIELIAALAESAEADQDFAHLGAGNLESLVCHGQFGGVFIDEVERTARQSPAFACVLTFLWVGEQVEPGLRRRLLALGAIDVAARGAR